MIAAARPTFRKDANSAARSFRVGATWGGSRNGTLTTIEDFLEEKHRSWRNLDFAEM